MSGHRSCTAADWEYSPMQLRWLTRDRQRTQWQPPSAGASRRLASAILQPKSVGMEPPIRVSAGNIGLLSGLRLKCSKCGERSASGSGKDIETTLVYTEGELKGFLRGE
jgi:hypothetical protein